MASRRQQKDQLWLLDLSLAFKFACTFGCDVIWQAASLYILFGLIFAVFWVVVLCEIGGWVASTFLFPVITEKLRRKLHRTFLDFVWLFGSGVDPKTMDSIVTADTESEDSVALIAPGLAMCHRSHILLHFSSSIEDDILAAGFGGSMSLFVLALLSHAGSLQTNHHANPL